MIPCPKCSRENADDALYCDQCRTAVSEEVEGAVLDQPCPACGGQLKEVPSAVAMCKDCGIFLGASGHAEDHEEPEAKPKRFVSAAPQPQAEPEAEEPEAPVETEPCPVCDTENAVDAPQCSGCRIAFQRLRRVIPCPKCGEETSDDVCSCGAVMTLPKLLSYVDKSVRMVCTACKTLITAQRDACPDCGGKLRSADALKDYAASPRA